MMGELLNTRLAAVSATARVAAFLLLPRLSVGGVVVDGAVVRACWGWWCLRVAVGFGEVGEGWRGAGSDFGEGEVSEVGLRRGALLEL